MLRKYLKRFYSWQYEKTGLNGHVCDFSFDYDNIDTSNIIDIHKYSVKKHDIK